mgnify:FL=1
MGQKDHQIILGKGTDETLKLSVKTLQRHFAWFGSSCSGKTVSSSGNAGTHVSISRQSAGRPPILLCSSNRLLQSFVFR